MKKSKHTDRGLVNLGYELFICKNLVLDRYQLGPGHNILTKAAYLLHSLAFDYLME